MRSNRGKNGITACPRPFLRDCLSFLGVWYGRFCNINVKCAPQRFYTFRLVRCICLGIFCWLSPLPLLAEFGSNDKNNLQNVAFDVDEISTTNSNIYDFLRSALSNSGGNGYIGWTLNLMQDDVNTLTFQNAQLFNVLGYGYNTSQSGSLKQSLNTIINYLGYGSGNSVSSHLTSIMNQTNQIKTALGGDQYNTIADRLDDIINALNSTSTPTLPTDIATETTLSAFKSKYEDLANQFLTSWGFSGGSDGTFKDLVTPWYSIQKPDGYHLSYKLSTYRQTLTSTQNPFPVEWPRTPVWTHWFDFSSPQSVVIDRVCRDPFEALMHYWNNAETWRQRFDQGLAQKQAGNDWYAHTNMVAQIAAQVDRIVLPPENGREDSTFDPNTGEITTPSSGGTGSSGDEVIGFKPVYTNDFAVIEQDSTTVTNSFDFVQQKEIKDRYISDEMLDVGTYQEYGSAGGQFTGIIQLDAFKIDLSQHYDQYRLLVSTKNLETFRTAMGWVWKLLACISGFWFVLKIANLSSFEGAE